MPSYLDFDSTKGFRNFILGKTLTVENGPQSFTSESYTMQKTSDMSNVDPGDVVQSTDSSRDYELTKSATSNTFKPIEYFVKEDFTVIPRRANLSLYPYFETGQYHSFINIMSGADFDNESEMMKFAAWNIANNKQGPFYGRMQSNLYRTTAGKVRLLDALQGNTSTAINILTGREPMVEGNTKITVAKTLPGKGIDFLQTVTGVEFPWSEIPGDYLSNPKNPVIARPEAETRAGSFIQDVTGALGSLVGIQRRPTTTRKPSDLLIEYSGQRQKATLFDNLSYLKYGPDYTTTAISQNTSKVFTFVDNVAQGVKNFLGVEAPKLLAYIGDDRGNDVKKAMSDFNDRQVRSSYYLSILFDEVQAQVFLNPKNTGEGGSVAGRLTWLSTNSQNKLGVNNEEYSDEQSKLIETLSTNFAFRDDSILGITQQILDTMPDGGAARSHVANVIDQTSRVFREDDKLMSRGSNIKYVDKFTGSESGVEYCRVWTKDRSYMNYSDTMKRQGNVRKFGSSVLDKPWNINIYPNSNGNGGFDSSSTNMAKGKGDGFYAKKYMFSIENLAWKSSNTPGYTYNDLPYCERGSNGGRIMWFPPYGLKVTEQNQAKWEENTFLGRPEPVYTYQNTSRHGTVQFKVIVDHPSILNLLVKDHFAGMSDEEADNYINAFFAGCEDVDFYGLIRQYTTLTEDDVTKILAYLNGNGDTTTIKKYSTLIRKQPNTPKPKNEVETVEIKSELFFRNDYPDPNSRNRTTESDFSKLYDDYVAWQNDYLALFNTGFNTLQGLGWTPNAQNDYKALHGSIPETAPQSTDYDALRLKCEQDINAGFTGLTANYTALNGKLETLKSDLSGKTVQNISIKIQSRTSSVADDDYNLDLAYRRSYSMIKDVIGKIAKSPEKATEAMSKVVWTKPISDGAKESTEKPKAIKLKTLGYEGDGELTFDYVGNIGEQPPGSTSGGSKTIDCSDNYKIITSSALKRTAPVTFFCRESTLIVSYEKKERDDVVEEIAPQETIEIVENLTPSQMPSPPIDEMKRIIMKTLSECYYFKKLEEDSPVQFSSMKEKLRYFHPSFHSMTPEGLNSRLTFLQQCIRPGETIPIKGVSDASDLNARNTTFGPPPICVMRIGDFYNSKVAIRDVNIEFEEDLWDLNPEGIGVQPMIANVTLQISFIGGHGLEKPVEKLQNALSSNFYANTEMYDPRSISTESGVGGKDLTTFRKEFLESLVKDFERNNSTTSQAPNDTGVPQGQLIGEHDGSIEVSYDKLIYDEKTGLYKLVGQYYTSYVEFYNQIVKLYGTSIASIFLSPTYRSITDYTVYSGPSTTQTIQLFGAYPKGADFEVLRRNFKEQILSQIKNDNISNMFGFNKDLTAAVLRLSEDILNPYIYKRVGEIIDDMSIDIDMVGFEKRRNSVIKALDGLNFIIETEHDGSISGEDYQGVTFDSGYTSDALYSTYSNVVDYITQAEPLFSEDLDTTTYTFSPGAAIDSERLSKFLSELLNSEKEKKGINKLYENNETIFTTRIRKDIEKRINKFMTDVPSNKDFSSVVPKNMPVRQNDLPVVFEIEDLYDFTEPEKVKLKNTLSTSPNKTINELNYYR